MAEFFSELTESHKNALETAPVFFVATAPSEGRINLSPKGMDSLRVAGPNRVLWLNVTGSGNETAGHLIQSNRMTLMWCGFETRPLILRAYGTARTVHRRDADWPALAAQLPAIAGARQIFDMTVDLVQSSCGYAVPRFDHAGERDILLRWAEARGPDELARYWDEKNRATIDGAPTGI